LIFFSLAGFFVIRRLAFSSRANENYFSSTARKTNFRFALHNARALVSSACADGPELFSGQVCRKTNSGSALRNACAQVRPAGFNFQGKCLSLQAIISSCMLQWPIM
jgi:hypothetical protein